MNVRECASFGRLKCKPDIDVDSNSEACLSRPIWVGQRIDGKVLQEVISPNKASRTCTGMIRTRSPVKSTYEREKIMITAVDVQYICLEPWRARGLSTAW